MKIIVKKETVILNEFTFIRVEYHDGTFVWLDIENREVWKEWHNYSQKQLEKRYQNVLKFINKPVETTKGHPTLIITFKGLSFYPMYINNIKQEIETMLISHGYLDKDFKYEIKKG